MCLSNGRANVEGKYGVTRTAFATLALARLMTRGNFALSRSNVRFWKGQPRQAERAGHVVKPRAVEFDKGQCTLAEIRKQVQREIA